MIPKHLFNGRTPKESADNAEFLAALIRYTRQSLLPDADGRVVETLTYCDPHLGVQPVPVKAIAAFADDLARVELRERKRVLAALEDRGRR